MHDLRGQRFGRLIAIEPTEKRWRSQILWRCLCDCGREKFAATSHLRNGMVKSCGCLQDESRRRDITGERRGKLTALYPIDADEGATIWAWRCDCGNIVHKSIRSVSGSYGSRLCGDCAAKIKSEQAAAMVQRIRRDDQGRNITQNAAIRAGKLTASNTSGVRGVSWHAASGKWEVRVSINGKTRAIGYYTTLEEAAKARAEAVQRIYDDHTGG